MEAPVDQKHSATEDLPSAEPGSPAVDDMAMTAGGSVFVPAPSKGAAAAAAAASAPPPPPAAAAAAAAAAAGGSVFAPAPSKIKTLAAAAAAARPPQNIPGVMLVSPFFGISAQHFAALLAHHMQWHAAFGITRCYFHTCRYSPPSLSRKPITLHADMFARICQRTSSFPCLPLHTSRSPQSAPSPLLHGQVLGVHHGAA